MTPTFFETAAAFREWLERHHARATELWVGYYKKSSGRSGMVYLEALEEALCFGWIDGRVQSVDAETYMHRWTPRRRGSYWSAVNIRRVEALLAAGRMHPAGITAFEARSAAPPRRYSFENTGAAFDPAMLKQFKAKRKAWTWFEQQPPSFRKVAVHWVTSAKKPETRASRLATLIACAAKGERPRPFQVSRARSAASRQGPAAAGSRTRRAGRRATHSGR